MAATTATTFAPPESQGVTDEPIAERVARLSALAKTSPVAAREEGWAWFAELGRRARRDRGDALTELGELFRAGAPATGIDGPTEGALVTFTMQPALDTAIAALTTAWLPWAGKRFDDGARTGDNLLLRSARFPSKLLWPLYSTRDAGRHLAAFDFETRVEPGAHDEDRNVLVIDYAPVNSNPALIIKSIRDELVQVVPGANLGKMLWRHGDGERHSLLAYFALRSSLGD